MKEIKNYYIAYNRGRIEERERILKLVNMYLAENRLFRKDKATILADAILYELKEKIQEVQKK